jgi:hypothetical protein
MTGLDDELLRHLQRLAAGESIQKPRYCMFAPIVILSLWDERVRDEDYLDAPPDRFRGSGIWRNIGIPSGP